MSSTRTSWPYFSPNSITAPELFACSIGITCARVGVFLRISALTRASTSLISASVSSWLSAEATIGIRWAWANVVSASRTGTISSLPGT